MRCVNINLEVVGGGRRGIQFKFTITNSKFSSMSYRTLQISLRHGLPQTTPLGAIYPHTLGARLGNMQINEF